MLAHNRRNRKDAPPLKRLSLIQHPYDSGIRDFRMDAARAYSATRRLQELADARLDAEGASAEIETEPGSEITRTPTALAALAVSVGTAPR